MLKMLMDPMGGIVMTNDGNAILREVDCNHPAAKSMIELARAQDEEVLIFPHHKNSKINLGR
jgi:T-complex protein 1 subunit gamma